VPNVVFLVTEDLFFFVFWVRLGGKLGWVEEIGPINNSGVSLCAEPVASSGECR